MNTHETARLPQPIIWRYTVGHNTHYFEALTARELEVLRLVGDGLSNQDIGDVLGIDERTTRSHVSSILSKTAARNRTHLVRMAIEAGIIIINAPPDPTDAMTLLTLASHYMQLAQQALENGR